MSMPNMFDATQNRWDADAQFANIYCDASGMDFIKALDEVFAEPETKKRKACDFSRDAQPCKRVCDSKPSDLYIPLPLLETGKDSEFLSSSILDVELLELLEDSDLAFDECTDGKKMQVLSWSSPESGVKQGQTADEGTLETLTPRLDSSSGWTEASASSNEASDLTAEYASSDMERLLFERYLESISAVPFPSLGGQSCLFCPHKTFFRRHDLCVHVRTFHLHERRFECHYPLCDAKFKRKGHLDGHIKMIHQKLEEFGCKHCGKAFCSDSSKRKHIRTIHRTQEYN